MKTCTMTAALARFGGACWIIGCAASPPPAPTASPAAAAPPAAVADHRLHVTTTYEPAGMHLQAAGRELALRELPMVDWVGLPMSGVGEVAVDLHVPIDHGREDWRAARGTIELRCPARCTLGDDHAALPLHITNPRTAAFAGELTFGHLDLDQVEVRIALADGHAEVTKWSVASNDVELTLALRLELAAAFADAKVTGCVRFRATPALQARDPRTAAMIATTGAPLASDGLFNLRLTGSVGAVRRLGQICDGSVATPPDPPVTAAADPPAPPAVPEEAPAVDDATLIARSVKLLSDGAFELAAPLVARLARDPALLLAGARFVPASKDGRQVGYKLYAIRPGSLHAKLGLSNGDTLRAINGFELGSADAAREIYRKILSGQPTSAIEIELDRRGKPLTLRYVLR